MKNDLKLLNKGLTNGSRRNEKTGVGTIGLFRAQLRFNQANTLPVITTTFMNVKAVIHELLWFIGGNAKIKYLQDNSVLIWNEWGDENGNLGHVSGVRWSAW
jgi:thymidylate synthase